VPGEEYNELARVQIARNYLDWYGPSSTELEAFLQWTGLTVEQVREMLEESNGHCEAPPDDEASLDVSRGPGERVGSMPVRARARETGPVRVVH
jgi:hypothetical protein